MRDQREKCPNCGTRHSDWDGDPFAFVAESRVCFGCEVIEQEKRNVPEHQEGIQFFLVPKRLASEVG